MSNNKKMRRLTRMKGKERLKKVKHSKMRRCRVKQAAAKVKQKGLDGVSESKKGKRRCTLTVE